MLRTPDALMRVLPHEARFQVAAQCGANNAVRCGAARARGGGRTKRDVCARVPCLLCADAAAGGV